MAGHEETTERPFSLPLGREQFAAALRKGLGRALMHVRQCGVTGFEELILDACARNLVFDPQCEQERSPWLLELAGACGLEAAAGNRVVAALRSSAADPASWDAHQLRRLALLLAGRGREDARAALYGALRPSDDTADFFAVEEIIELDGADGLVHVARRSGEWIATDATREFDDSALRFYDERYGRGSAERLLESLEERDERIALYLSHVREPPDEELEATGPDSLDATDDEVSYADLVRKASAEEMIRDSGSAAPWIRRFSSRRWGRYADESSLRTVAEHLFTVSDAEQLVRLLAVFQRRALAEFDARFLAYVDHPVADVRWMTNCVLSNYAHEEVRALALERARAGRQSEGELRLFARNYRPGDWAIIRDGLRWPSDDDELHRILQDLLDVFESNPLDEAREPLRLVYELTPCTICRGGAVRLLVRNGWAPAWMIEECRFDADGQTRELVT